MRDKGLEALWHAISLVALAVIWHGCEDARWCDMNTLTMDWGYDGKPLRHTLVDVDIARTCCETRKQFLAFGRTRMCGIDLKDPWQAVAWDVIQEYAL